MGSLRRRMSAELLASKPFEQLASACESLIQALQAQDAPAIQQGLQYLRALLGGLPPRRLQRA